MSKFKKIYTDTFDNVHAPRGIKEEVLNMAKKLDNTQNNDTLDVVQEDTKVSHKVRPNALIVFATCIVLVAGSVGVFSHLINQNGRSDLTDVSNTVTSQTTTLASNTDTTLLANYNVSNDNFKEVFGVDQKYINCVFTTDSQNVPHICGQGEDINNVLNSFNTDSWTLDTNPIPNNNEIDVILSSQLNISSIQDNAIVEYYVTPIVTATFYTLKSGDDSVYVRINDTYSDLDHCYLIDNDTFQYLQQTINEYNYIDFNRTPNGSLGVTYHYNNDEEYTISDDIKDKEVLSNLNSILYQSLKWKQNSLTDWNSYDNTYPTLTFSVFYNNADYTINLYRHDGDDNTILAQVLASTTTDTIAMYYSLSSNNLEEDYQRLLTLATQNINTSNTIVTTQDSQSTTVTTTTPKDTTTSSTTKTTTATTTTSATTTKEAITTTTPPVTTTVTEATVKKTFQLATPDLKYAITTQDYNTLPQFLNDTQKQVLADAYSIEQGVAFGCIFDYTSDSITIDDRSYNRIKSSEITSLEDVRNYYRQYFTDSYIDSHSLMSYVTEYNGKVYGVDSARGGDITYIGHSFNLSSQTDDTIDFTVTAYYQDFTDCDYAMYQGDYFYNQEPTIPYTTKTYNYRLVFTEDGWRVDSLEVLM